MENTANNIQERGNYWSTEKVDKLLRDAEEIGIDYKELDNPFHENDPELRKGDILFEYTEEELEEIKKCATDVVYFANKYCHVMTDEGIRQIILRDYQIQILRQYQNHRKNIFVSPRQSGKTITSSIFLLWYLLFNYEKNAIIMANIGDTAAELMDKIKIIMKGLPFFMKPGLKIYNVMTMRFDNGCRIMAKTTTKTSSIGYTVHMLYMDEFAHINANFIDSFFRSVYPTISSSQIARIIITSTPNGQNKFYEIYKSALDKENDFNPIRVEWWQVPGRDEEWKKKEIASLGSEEDFNQEYGCQFLASSRLLLDSSTLKKMRKNQQDFVFRELSPFENSLVDYSGLTWHPKFDPTSVFESDANPRFVISIDTAGGGGGDFSVVNIFKVSPMPTSAIQERRFFDSESDFFCLLQIGMFRSNNIQIEELKIIIEILCSKVLGNENVKIVLELDYKGENLMDKLLEGDEIVQEMFIYTKHSESTKQLRPGVKLTPKNKEKYCEDTKTLCRNNRVVITEKNSVFELSNFGITSRGSYSSQVGKDDIAMTIVNVASCFENSDFDDLVMDVYDTIPEKFKKEIEAKLGMNSTDPNAQQNTDLTSYRFVNSLLDS